MSTKPVIGDYVEYVSDGHLVGGILADVWDSTLSGKRRARVVDSHAERKDPDAGRSLDYARLRLPEGQFHA